MKKHLLTILFFVAIFIAPKINFAQQLGTAHEFAVFTATGNIQNMGETVVTGSLGTNASVITGFPPGIVLGQTHNADVRTADAVTGMNSSNNDITAMDCTAALSTSIGNNQIVTPNVYCVGTGASMSGDLILDAQGNAGAVFIFKINGNFSTAKYTNIILINLASLENVYWQINGDFELGDSSVFMGTVIAANKIDLLEGSSVFGRILSLGGTITLDHNFITTGLSPLAIKLSAITAINADAGNRIEWTTESADRGDVFEVERSSDGKTFTQIAMFAAETQSKTYSFWDGYALTGMNYYRLKLKEASGKFVYSPIVTANRKVTTLSVKAFPSLVTNNLSVIIKGTTGKDPVITITDISGRTIRTIIVNSDRMDINTTNLTPGIYFVKYRDTNNSQVIKINKQR